MKKRHSYSYSYTWGFVKMVCIFITDTVKHDTMYIKLSEATDRMIAGERIQVYIPWIIYIWKNRKVRLILSSLQLVNPDGKFHLPWIIDLFAFSLSNIYHNLFVSFSLFLSKFSSLSFPSFFFFSVCILLSISMFSIYIPLFASLPYSFLSSSILFSSRSCWTEFDENFQNKMMKTIFFILLNDFFCSQY